MKTQTIAKPAPAAGAPIDEWAEGMPAWWLRRVDREQNLTPNEIARFYFVKPSRAAGSTVGYDQRLIVRVGGTEQAAGAVVDFVMAYVRSMEFGYKSVGIVQERFVRAWELAGRPTGRTHPHHPDQCSCPPTTSPR